MFNTKRSFLKEIFVYCYFFIQKDATCEDREMQKDQAIETNIVEKLSNSTKKRKKLEDIKVNQKRNKKRER